MKLPRKQEEHNQEINDISFTGIYTRYYSAINDYLVSKNIIPPDSDDLSQEVFTRLWEGRGKYQGRSSIKTYLFAIAKILVKEFYRINHTNSLKYKALQSILYRDREDLQPVYHLLLDELLDRIRRVKSLLSPKQCQVLDIANMPDYDAELAAKELDCPVNIMRQRVYDAKERFRLLLEEENGEKVKNIGL